MQRVLRQDTTMRVMSSCHERARQAAPLPQLNRANSSKKLARARYLAASPSLETFAWRGLRLRRAGARYRVVAGGIAMEPRIDYRKLVQEPIKALLGVEKYLASCGLEHKLLHLIKMRASQINGCAYCLDMHSLDARADGETEQRLYTLDAWAETPFFTDRERAALAWTEAVTLVSQTHVPDDVYAETKKHFSEKEIVDLTLALGMINLWNRLAISTRAVPGRYKPARTAAASGS